MIPDRIEREIVIDAPVEVVWAIVTEARHVGRWFSDAAEIELRPGGEALFTWEEHESARARIERVEPPHSFAFRWIRRTGASPRPGDSTLVELELATEGEGTRLRVVESCFSELAWPEEEKARYAEENRQGWQLELGELRDYVAEHMRGSAGA